MRPDWAHLRTIVLTAAGVTTAGSTLGCEALTTLAREMRLARPPSRCERPRQRMQQGPDGKVPTGFEYCGDGLEHRVAAVACVGPVPTEGSCGSDRGGECSTDADCTATPLGVCNGVRNHGCLCSYGCTTDADCAADEACRCVGEAGVCIKAYCHTDADCTGEYMCAHDGVLACHAPGDECRTNNDCPEGCYGCIYDPKDEIRECVDLGGKCNDGRPFLVDGQARTAPVVASDVWSAPLSPCPPLRERDLRVLAAHYLDAGLAEHASVAAFARFALELLALGAPADLVDACTRAQGDEIRHAQQCFALAQRYGGTPQGPGPLAMHGVMQAQINRLTVSVSVAYEACVGETLAAVQAGAAASHATDPEVRGTLAQIAEDELRHARLGWRFIRWSLDGADNDERALILDALWTAATSTPAAARTDDDAPALVAHGRLPTSTMQRLRRDALRELVWPAIRGLEQARAA